MNNSALKVSMYGVFSGLNIGKYRPEKAPYLDTFHAVNSAFTLLITYDSHPWFMFSFN